MAHITPERTLLEIARVAYADIASFFNLDGSLKKPAELDEDQRAALAGFEACIKNAEAGDGKQDLIHKFKSWDKVRALEMLAKHFRLLGEQDEKPPAVVINTQTVQIAQILSGTELLQLRERLNAGPGAPVDLTHHQRDGRAGAPIPANS